ELIPSLEDSTIAACLNRASSARLRSVISSDMPTDRSASPLGRSETALVNATNVSSRLANQHEHPRRSPRVWLWLLVMRVPHVHGRPEVRDPKIPYAIPTSHWVSAGVASVRCQTKHLYQF